MLTNINLTINKISGLINQVILVFHNYFYLYFIEVMSVTSILFTIIIQNSEYKKTIGGHLWSFKWLTHPLCHEESIGLEPIVFLGIAPWVIRDFFVNCFDLSYHHNSSISQHIQLYINTRTKDEEKMKIFFDDVNHLFGDVNHHPCQHYRNQPF